MDRDTFTANFLEWVNSIHNVPQEVTVSLHYYPCPRATIKVFPGSISYRADLEDLNFLCLINCEKSSSYQPLVNSKELLDRYRDQALNCRKSWSPCGGWQCLQADFASFEENIHFCLKQVFNIFNVIGILFDTPMSGGFVNSPIPSVFTDIVENHSHGITQVTVCATLVEGMSPLLKAIGKIRVFRVLVKSEKTWVPERKIKKAIQRSVDLVRQLDITVVLFHWNHCATKLTRFDLAEWNLLRERPAITANLVMLTSSAMLDLMHNWKKSPIFVMKLLVTMQVTEPVQQLMLMKKETTTAKKKAKKLLKTLIDSEKKNPFGGNTIPIAIIDSTDRFLMLEAEPIGGSCPHSGFHASLHIYTVEK